MKIKKLDDKPMVIHVKEKAKLHTHEPKQTSIKGSNVYTVERSPKIKGSAMEQSASGKKQNFRKSTIHQDSDKKTSRFRQYRNAVKESKQSLHMSKKGSTIKLAGAAGVRAAGSQMEGSEEIEQAAMIAYGVSRPVTGTASKGAELFRQRSLAEKRKKIKQVASGKKLARKAVKKTSQKVAKKAAKDTAKAVAKETAKETAKVTAKVTASAAATAAGTATTGAFGPLIGIAAGEVVGAKIDHDDMKRSSRSRKVKFFLDKMKSQEQQQDSVAKLVKDLFLNRMAIPIKKMMVAVGGFLLVLILLISVITVPVITVVATIYNSPFAIFLPPLEAGDTVMSVTSSYVAEFNRDTGTLANEHTGYDKGVVVYVDYEGASATPSNYYDIMAVYMVKHGVGDTATVMNDTSKQWLRDVFDDMCSYTTSTGTETVENEDGTTSSQTVLYVNVVLKTYRDMMTEYGFSTEQISMLNDMMRLENLAILGYTGGNGGGGNSQSSMTQAEIDAIVNTITDPKQKLTCAFALSKVGYPYSQDLRDSGDYYDCSSLAYYAWKSAGVDISYGGATTAAAEAQYCVENGYTVTEEELQPGDLIFYSYTANGRYKNVSHVGIYVGNGKMVEAANETKGVIFCDFHSGSAVVYGRPQ